MSDFLWGMCVGGWLYLGIEALIRRRERRLERARRARRQHHVFETPYGTFKVDGEVSEADAAEIVAWVLDHPRVRGVEQ